MQLSNATGQPKALKQSACIENISVHKKYSGMLLCCETEFTAYTPAGPSHLWLNHMKFYLLAIKLDKYMRCVKSSNGCPMKTLAYNANKYTKVML